MEEINEEKINQEAEKIENTTPQEVAETVEQEATEAVEAVKEEVDECICTCNTEEGESCEKKPGNKKLWGILAAVLGVLAIVAIILACMGKFSKYPGFKKDRATGLYYQFYGDIHDTAAMPKTGDLVGILFSLRAGDSLLIPMMPNEMIMDSLYEGDFYNCIRMMHVGDSATFILNGKEFFQNFMNGQDYPFGDDPLYADIKLYGQLPHDQFVKMQAEYEKAMKEKQGQEEADIQAYVSKNGFSAPTEEGIYYKTVKKGTGAQPQMMQDVEVHYTGRLLDGTVFDSSVERGETYKFTLGAHQVIPGWEIALSKMHVGEKATVLIPSRLAYGERGNYSIPPFSPLVFDIELINIADAQAE